MNDSEAINPMRQFEIKDVFNIDFFGYNFAVTNGSIVMSLVVLFSFLIWISLRRCNKIVPSRGQSAIEMSLVGIRDIVSGSLGKSGKRYVPLVFSVFLFVLLLNLFGLVPGSLAQTSHISVTFALAMIVFFVCVFITLCKRGIGFFKIFLPAGTPWWLAPLMFVLEFFSYLVRPVSLSVRLAANMIAGHVMLDVIAIFVVMMGIFGVLPFAFLAVLMAFELFVAFLQAYIFSIFACVYISEACEGGH